ncbi:hypothetical protein HK100_007740 [Physocladia obscura]|uniref:Rhomboid-type serine protease n=1 Tax=Physocladia obscura TaxID=109957 RepID=A0AAD5X840_9FUNG|nr:hypothetical protein HK100_007740 [Physocladia obscura]
MNPELDNHITDRNATDTIPETQEEVASPVMRTAAVANYGSFSPHQSQSPSQPNIDQYHRNNTNSAHSTDPQSHRTEHSASYSTLNDNQYTFYSNPVSYAPSTTGNRQQQLLQRDQMEYRQHQNYTNQHQFDTRKKDGYGQPVTFSADTIVDDNEKFLKGSQPTYFGQSDTEIARAIAESENSPSDPTAQLQQQHDPILHSPYVRNQMADLKVHRPYFLYVVTAIQIIVLIIELVVNHQNTGSFIDTNPFNIMIGPSAGVLIQVGARFTPCIRPNTPYDAVGVVLECPDGDSSSTTVLSGGVEVETCTLDQICGMGGLNGKSPNQWFRFITPIFLHGGVIHLLMNLAFQCRTGFQMEEDFGWWRMGAIYLISGIGGFIFGGLIACLLIDLVQNWRLVKNPKWELAKLVFLIIISLLLGTIPYFDNFAHVGGFFTGFLAGLIFMPTIYYTQRDKVIKITLQVIAVPVLITVYVLMIVGFYNMPFAIDTLELLRAMYEPTGEFELIDPPQIPDDLLTVNADIHSITVSITIANPNTQTAHLLVSLPLDNNNSKNNDIKSDNTKSVIELSLKSEPWMSRDLHTKINALLPTPARTEATDEPSSDAIFEAIEIVRGAISALDVASDVEEKRDEKNGNTTVTEPLVRYWYTLISLSTREKRNDLVQWAPTFGLTGFVMAGKPAVVCCEGQASRIDAYMSEIKALSWADVPSHQKKISITCQETIAQRKFTEMTEITHLFTMGGHRGNRPDLGQVKKWFDDHNVGKVFPLVFGGPNSPFAIK